MGILTTRRGFLGLFAAPAVVVAANIMPVKLWVPEPVKIITPEIITPEPLVAKSLGLSVRRGDGQWVPVGLVENIGHYYDDPISLSTIADGRLRKAKAFRHPGELSIGCFHDPSDAGQAVLSSAECEFGNREFRIDPQDGGNPLYLQGIIASERLRLASDDDVARKDFRIYLTSAVVDGN